MTIHKFINPKTNAYKTFKEHVLSIQFSWYYYKNISPDMFNIGGDKYTNIDAYHHSFPHKNLIIYLNDPAGGDTVLVDKDYKEIDRHHPKEDDIISFEGIHYQKMPKEDRRIVLVVTYI